MAGQPGGGIGDHLRLKDSVLHRSGIRDGGGLVLADKQSVAVKVGSGALSLTATKWTASRCQIDALVDPIRMPFSWARKL